MPHIFGTGLSKNSIACELAKLTKSMFSQDNKWAIYEIKLVHETATKLYMGTDYDVQPDQHLRCWVEK